MFKYQNNKSLQYSLIPKLEGMKDNLRHFSPEQLVNASGGKFGNNRLVIEVFFQPFEIDLNSFVIRNKDKEVESVLFHCIVFTYLMLSDGTPQSNTWISFRELPNGYKYCNAFQGYAPDRLSKFWGLNIDGFSKTCRKIGGVIIDLGDSAFKFKVFPKIDIGVVYWNGDENYPPKASVLFNANIKHYMVTAGLATIGNELVDQILKNADNSYISDRL